MKQKTPEQELELLREGLLHERAIWEHINENGCNDPDLGDSKGIGNTCVGLTGYEMKLFIKKMKQLKMYSGKEDTKC